MLDFCFQLTATFYWMAYRTLELDPGLSLQIHLFILSFKILYISPIKLKLLFFKQYFFTLFIPLIPLPTSYRHNHHTVVHTHESFFLFAQSLHPLNSSSYLSAPQAVGCLLSSTCSPKIAPRQPDDKVKLYLFLPSEGR